MKKIFKTSVIEIVKIENEDVLTAVSGAYSEDELPLVPFSE